MLYQLNAKPSKLPTKPGPRTIEYTLAPRVASRHDRTAGARERIYTPKKVPSKLPEPKTLLQLGSQCQPDHARPGTLELKP